MNSLYTPVPIDKLQSWNRENKYASDEKGKRTYRQVALEWTSSGGESGCIFRLARQIPAARGVRVVHAAGTFYSATSAPYLYLRSTRIGRGLLDAAFQVGYAPVAMTGSASGLTVPPVSSLIAVIPNMTAITPASNDDANAANTWIYSDVTAEFAPLWGTDLENIDLQFTDSTGGTVYPMTKASILLSFECEDTLRT